MLFFVKAPVMAAPRGLKFSKRVIVWCVPSTGTTWRSSHKNLRQAGADAVTLPLASNSHTGIDNLTNE